MGAWPDTTSANSLLPGANEHLGCAQTQRGRHRLLPSFIYNTMVVSQREAIRRHGVFRHPLRCGGTKVALDLEEKCSERSW
jgi:hypothetical protein